MKQMESVGHDRRSNSAKVAAAGVSRHSVVAQQDSPLMGEQFLQRTFGNTALARTGAGSRGTSTGRHAAPQDSAKAMQSIVARALAVPDVARKVQPAVVAGAPQIQRLISSTKFGKKTKLRGTGKSDTFFGNVQQELLTLEGMPQSMIYQDSSDDEIDDAQDELNARKKQMRIILKMGNEWLIGTDAKGSSRKSHVEDLVADLKIEIMKSVGQQGRNLANTAQGVGNEVLDKKGKKTGAQKQAITTVKGANLVPARKKHAIEMIRNPETIQQGAFGVCGLTAILYAVAKSNPQKFAELIRDAWADQQLVAKWLDVFYNNADALHISQRAEVEYVTSQWLVRKSSTGDVTNKVLDPDKKNQQDEVTDKTKKYTEVFQNQIVFSDSFNIDAWENTLGHFALTGGALSYLLNGLGTAKHSYKVKHGTFGRDYPAAKAAAGTGTVIASVTDTDFYTDDTWDSDKAFVPEKPQPKFVHWVVLKDAQLQDPYWNLKLWTWRNNYTTKLHKNVIDSYIHTLVAAEAG